jgi:deoxyribose-phosphate aldolase
MELAQAIEHTRLKPDLKDKEIDKLLREAIEYGFHGICVPPFWVKRAHREAGNSGIKIITVAGFPLGYSLTETRIEEINRVIDHGADEVDIVWNLSAFRSDMPWCKIDIARCVQTAHSKQRILKVILETSLLSDEEITDGCKICADAGADFVKTSTGYAEKGASVEAVSLMRAHLPDYVAIKASGGIKTYAFAKELVEAGASRLGCSSSIEIITGKTATGNY